MSNRLRHHPLTHILITLLLGTLAYANSFGVPFVFDDLEGITGNEVIRDLRNFLPGGPGYEYSRRWVGMLSFALNYRLGGLDVTGYHLFNLAVHLGTAALVYVLVLLAFRTPRLVDSQLAPRATTAALLAALFFVAHPVQTQAITYIVQRLASLCTFFYLLSLVLYVWGRLRLEAAGDQTPATRPQPLITALPFAGSLLAAVLAMFTKEIAFTLPLAALLFELCFFQGEWRKRLLLLLPLLLTLAIIPVLVLTSQELTAAGTFVQTRVEIPRLHYLFTQFPVIVTYLRLLLLPINQNLDYDYPIYTTFFTPPVALSFLLLTGLLTLAIWLFRKSATRQPAPSPQPTAPELRLIAFGIFWFFLTISIESGLIPLADVIFEHRLYLPSIGLAGALAVAVLMISRKTSTLLAGRLPLLAAAAVILALTTATWQRNQVWRNEVALWEDTTRKSPGKARPWYNLGTHLKDTGSPAEALAPLMRAVSLDPQYAEAWHNLGLAYLMIGRNAEAVEPLRTAVHFNPEMDNATVNYAVALILTKRPMEAVTLLERNIHRFPSWADARLNLGIAYVGIGDLPSARRELAILKRLDPRVASRLADQIRRAGANQPQ